MVLDAVEAPVPAPVDTIVGNRLFATPELPYPTVLLSSAAVPAQVLPLAQEELAVTR